MPFIIGVFVLPKWPIFGITEKCTFFRSVDRVVLGSSDTVPAVNKTQNTIWFPLWLCVSLYWMIGIL